jgi:acetyltransferase
MEMHRLSDGTEVLVRPIGPGDESLIEELHAAHSEHPIRMRFFGLVRHLSHDDLAWLCHLDHGRQTARAALHRGADGRPHMIGVSLLASRVREAASSASPPSTRGGSRMR